MIHSTVLAALALIAGAPAFAQYPDRTLTIVSGFPAGGMVDIVARTLAESMKKRFPKGLLLVSRPGAAGTLAVGEVVRAQPDGYTLVLSPSSAMFAPGPILQGLTLRGLTRASIRALGASAVAHATDIGPALSATLDTPRGRVTLTSN